MATTVIAPAGVTPASFFVPGVAVVSPALPPAILADNIGPDGEIASMLTRIHPVDAAVREAFRLQRGTGVAVQEAGHDFFAIKKNTIDAPRKLEDEANRILATFIRRGDIKLIGPIRIDASLAPDLAAVFVQYQNLQTQTPQQIGGN